MSVTERKEGARRSPHKGRQRILPIILELFAFVTLVVGITLVVRPLTTALTHRMEALRDQGLAVLESTLGRRVEYESLGASLFGFLDIRNLRILGKDGKPVLSASRVRIGYSLGEFLSGNPLRTLRSLRFDVLRVSLNKGRDDDLISRFSRPIGEGEGVESLVTLFPFHGVDLRIRDFKFQYQDGQRQFTLFLPTLDADVGEGLISFSGSADLSYDGFADAPAGFRSADLSGQGSGTYDLSSARGDFLLSISRLNSDNLSLKNLTVSASLDAEGLEVRKTRDRAPYDLVVRYSASEGLWSGEFRSENFIPRSHITVGGNWKPYDPWLDLTLTGTLTGTFRPGTVPSYQMNLSAVLPREFPFGRGMVAARGRGQGDRVYVDNLSYSGDLGSAVFRGELAIRSLGVDGRLSVREFLTPKGDRLRGEFEIWTEGAEYILFGEDVGIGAVEFSALDARLVPSDDALDFSLSALRFADLESYEDVRMTRIDAEGTLLPADRLLHASVSVESLSASDAVALAEPFAALPIFDSRVQEELERIFITTEFFITTNFVNLSVNAPRLVAAYRGVQDFFLIASLSGTDTRMKLQEGKLLWSGGSLDLSTYLDYSDTSNLAFGAQAVYLDIPYSIDGIFMDGRTVSLQGSYGLSSHLTIGENGGISGFFVAEGLPIPINGAWAYLGASVSYRWNSASSWSLTVDRFDVAELSLPTSPSTNIRLRGSATESGLRVTNLSYDDGRGVLSGRASMSWSEGYTNPTLNLRLADQTGEERYEAEGTLHSGGVELRVHVASAKAARFLSTYFNALATGELRLSWTSADAFSADWRLSRLQARLGETELVVAASGSVDPRGLSLEDVRLTYGSLELDVATASINFDSSMALASGRLWGVAQGMSTEITLDGSVSFAPIDSWSTIARALDSFDGILRVPQLRLDSWRLEDPFELRLSKDAEFLSLSGGPRDSLRFRLGADGAFYSALSYPSPIRGSLTGTLIEGIIEGKTENLYLDMAALWAFLPEDIKNEVTFTGGFAEASVRVSGPLGDPEFFGSAQGAGLSLKVPKWVGAEIEPIGVVMALEGNRMSFGPIGVRVGSGRGTASGSFIFERWVPSTVDLDLSVNSGQSIPFVMESFGVNAAGSVYGALNITVGSEGFGIRGRLIPHNTLITLDTRSMASLLDQEADSDLTDSPNPILVDLLLTFGRRVEFAWPVFDFPIIRGYADVGTGFVVKADTGIGRFSMDGDVRLRGGEVFYFQRSFYIREGVLRFNESELGVDPKVVLRAELRDRTEIGAVTVALVVDEAPLSRFTPRLESNPPLSQLEIFSLLGQNLAGTNGATNGARFQDALLTASSDVLAQFNVIRVFERNVRDALGLDMFSVRTQVLQNAVLQATGFRPDPIDRMGGLGNYFDNTTVFFGKYFGSDLFLQSLFSLRYDEFRSYELFGGLTLEPDIGVEMETPLFTLRWNFMPTVGNSENLFIDDHSFTLSWKWFF